MPLHLPKRFYELALKWGIPDYVASDLLQFFNDAKTSPLFSNERTPQQVEKTLQRVIDLIPIQYILPREIRITKKDENFKITTPVTKGAITKIHVPLRDIIKYDEEFSPIMYLFQNAKSVPKLSILDKEKLGRQMIEIKNGLDFIEAVYEDDLSKVQEFISLYNHALSLYKHNLQNQEPGVKLTLTNCNNKNAVYLAAEMKHENVLKLLLEYPIICIDQPNNKGDTALYIALENELVDLAEMLLNKNANPNKLNNAGEASLHKAISYISNEGILKNVINMLLNKNANINQANKQGKTSLHVALDKGLKHIPQILLLNGADPSIKDNDGNMSLHIAASVRSYIGLVKNILKDYPINIDEPNEQKKTPMHIATKNNCFPMIETLLEYQPNLRAQDQDGDTCVHMAIQGRYCKGIDKFLEFIKPDLMPHNNKGETLLYKAVTMNPPNEEIIKTLVERGAKVNGAILNKLDELVKKQCKDKLPKIEAQYKIILKYLKNVAVHQNMRQQSLVAQDEQEQNTQLKLKQESKTEEIKLESDLQQQSLVLGNQYRDVEMIDTSEYNVSASGGQAKLDVTE